MTITERKLAIALEDLRKARALARGAGAPYAAIAIQRAIKSTEGAKNHARGRASRGVSKHQPRRVTRPRTRAAETVKIYELIPGEHSAIARIVRELDAKEWSPDTLDAIAAILRDAGHEIKDPE